MLSSRIGQPVPSTALGKSRASIALPRGIPWIPTRSMQRLESFVPAANKIFTAYELYKDMAACKVYPIAPQFVSTQTSDFRMQRQGAFIIELANVLPTQRVPGQRNYDYSTKLNLALYPDELMMLNNWNFDAAPLVITHTRAWEGRTSHKVGTFSKGRSGPGMIQIEILDQTNNNAVRVEITAAELKVIQCLGEFCVPRLLAFDALFQDLPQAMPYPDPGMAMQAPGQPMNQQLYR